MTVIFELLLEFLQIGLFSIGGGYAVIPLIKEHAVDLKGWLSIQEFTDIITISQMTPGPLAVNTSTFVGLQTGGCRRYAGMRILRLCDFSDSMQML